jgi:hypothetical protein
LIVPETARFMATRLSDASLVPLEPAGHMAVFERHDRLVAALSMHAGAVFASERAPQPDRKPQPGMGASRTAQAS